MTDGVHLRVTYEFQSLKFLSLENEVPSFITPGPYTSTPVVKIYVTSIPLSVVTEFLYGRNSLLKDSSLYKYMTLRPSMTFQCFLRILINWLYKLNYGQT